LLPFGELGRHDDVEEALALLAALGQRHLYGVRFRVRARARARARARTIYRVRVRVRVRVPLTPVCACPAARSPARGTSRSCLLTFRARVRD